METTSLYVHIPFCQTICSYCDFCKVYYDKEMAWQYLEILNKELKALNIRQSLKTVYIGGGTPSALSDEQLEYLMDMLKPYVKECEEYCIEVNPESMDRYKLMILKQGGINRLSIGVQTFQNELLKKIERHHNQEQVMRIIHQAKQMGFDNISIDLMYGLPDQTLHDIQKDLDIVESLDIEHISYYSLILENNTILKYQQYQPIDSETELQLNIYIDKALKEMGFEKYEISNYAKKSYQSKHNLVYWHYENYYGIGVGAAAKIDDRIIEHSRSLTKYLQQNDCSHIVEESRKETMFNHLMMSMRLCAGLNLQDFQERYHCDACQVYEHAIEKNVKRGLLEINDGYLKTTDQGMFVLNEILLDFM